MVPRPSERTSSVAARQARPLVHSRQTEALTDDLGVKAIAVVLHLDQQLAIGLPDSYPDPTRAGVLGDIHERLLEQPVDGGLEILLETLLLNEAGQRQLALDVPPALLAVAVEQRLDRGAQTQLVQSGRPQLGDDRAQISDLALDVRHSLAHRDLRPREIVDAEGGCQE